MVNANFDGGASASVTSSWQGWGGVDSTGANGVDLPTGGTLAFNGNRPVYVTTARFWVAGRGGSRSIRAGIGGQYSGYVTVASGTAAVAKDFTMNKVWQNGGSNLTTRLDGTTNDAFYFGRGADGTGLSTDDNGNTWSGSLSGYATYFYVPTAPTIGTAIQNGVSQDVDVTWTAPSDTQGGITGYTIDYSTDSGFASYSSITTGNVLTYKVTGLTYGQTYYFRVRAINAAATAAGTTSVASASTSMTLVVPGTDDWTSFGTLPANNTLLFERNLVPSTSKTGLHRKVTATATGGSYSTGNFGMQRVLTGLTVGYTYKMNAKAKLGTAGIQGNIYRLNVTGKTAGTSLTVTTSEQSFAEYSFVATATSHTIRVELAETYTVSPTGTVEDLYIYDLVVTRVAEDLTETKGYWIQDNKYSAALNDHYQLTMDSIGGFWWVDKNNKTQFAQDTASTIAVGTWTDGQEFVGGVLTPGQSLPGELHYNDIQINFDTTRVINDVTLENEGITSETTDSPSKTAFQTSWNNKNSTSADEWSTRKAELKTNLWLDSVDNLITNPSSESDIGDIYNGATTTSRLKRKFMMRATSGYTSTTSNTIGLGTKSFTMTFVTTYIGKEGQTIRLWNTANSKNFVQGTLVSVNSTTKVITVDVNSTGGSGTYTAWTGSLMSAIPGENMCTQMKVYAATTAAVDPYWNADDQGVEILVEPGEAYFAKAYVARGAGSIADAAATVSMRFYDDGGTFISQISSATTTLANAHTWYEFNLTGIAPDNANNVALRIVTQRAASASQAIGTTYLYDGIMLTPAITINTQTTTTTLGVTTLTTLHPHGIKPGDSVYLYGFTPTGYNGTWTAQAGTTGSTLKLNIPTNPGAITVGSGAVTIGTYFDGNTTDTSSYIYDWLGTENKSQSRRSENILETRVQEILTEFADPVNIATSLTWNAAEDPLVASQLDVGSLIYLKFNGVEASYRVIGLEHEITPEEWLITINVQTAS